MKILSVLNPVLDDYNISGAARLSINLANHIDTTDSVVDFVANPCIIDMIPEKSKVYTPEIKSKSRYMKDIISYVVDIFQNMKYDILHIHIHQMSVLSHINESIPKNIPVVYTQHSSTILGRFSLGYRDSARELSTCKDRNIALVMPSNAMKDIWTEYIGTDYIPNVHTIMNAISDSPSCITYRDISKCRRYFSCGRIDPNKGMLEVAQLCIKTRTPIIIVGDYGVGTLKANSLQENYYRNFIETVSNNRDIITWVKSLPNESIRRIMAKSRGYISLSNKESFGLTVAESLSVGTPIIYLEDKALNEVIDSASNHNPCSVSTMISRDSIYRRGVTTRFEIYAGAINKNEEMIRNGYSRDNIISSFKNSPMTIANCSDNYMNLYSEVLGR